jgi:hypothetical protein
MSGSISNCGVVVKDPWFVGNVGSEVLSRACFGVSKERACRVVSEARCV